MTEGDKVEIMAVVDCADIGAHVVRGEGLPASSRVEIASGVAAQDGVGLQGDEVDVASVEGGAVEADGFGVLAAGIEGAIAGGVFEIALGVEPHDHAAFLGVGERGLGAVGVAGTAVDIAAVESRALKGVRVVGVPRCPAGGVFEVAMGVVAQETAVVDAAVVAGDEVDVASVEDGAVEASGSEAVGAAGIVGCVGLEVFEIAVGVVAQDAAVDRGAVLAVADGTVVDIASVENRAVEAAGVETVGAAGVAGAKGVEGRARCPLRNQGLQACGPCGVAADPGGDSELSARVG